MPVVRCRRIPSDWVLLVARRNLTPAETIFCAARRSRTPSDLVACVPATFIAAESSIQAVLVGLVQESDMDEPVAAISPKSSQPSAEVPLLTSLVYLAPAVASVVPNS